MKKIFVAVFAALVLVAFTVPAMAKVDVGGIVFTDFYYMKESKEAFMNPVRGDTYSRVRLQVPHMTRLKARWSNEDNVGMYIEIGLGGQNTIAGGNRNYVYLRHAYGWWDVSPQFTLMAGQSTTPFSQLFPSTLLGCSDGYLNIIGIGYGEFYSGRSPQVRGTFKFGKVARLEVALVDANTNTHPTNLQPFGIGDTDAKFPRIDIAVPLHFGPIKLYPSVFYNYKTFNSTSSAWTPGSDDDFQSWGASLGFRGGFGPVVVSAEYQYGYNWGNTSGTMGVSWAALNSGATTRLVGAKTEIDDTKCQSGWIDVGFKLGPATPHLIYGMFKVNGDENPNRAKSQMYGVSVPIGLAKGFIIRPEVMFYDNGDDNKSTTGATFNAGKHALYGVQFMIVF